MSTKILERGLARVVSVQPQEVRALLWSFAYFFCLLAGYYVLRPVRDEMGLASGIKNLPWLFTATLVGMPALNLPFAYLVKRMPRARFVPITYRFFAANILAFALTLYLAPPEWGVWIGRVFFVALGLVGALGAAAIYGVGAHLVVDGNISAGTLVALAALVTRVYQPLTGITNARVDLMTEIGRAHV